MNKLYHEREGHTGALNVISKERQAHERTLGERDEALRICKNRLDVINSLQNELHELESRQEDSLLQADRFLNVYGVSNLVNLSGDDIRHRVNMDEFPPPVFMRGTGMELWSELDVRKWMEGLKMFQAAAEGGGKDD
jgi:predicted DNA-binding transcriptional regulator AlpA